MINTRAANAPAAMHRKIMAMVASSIMSDITNGARVMIMPEVKIVCVDDTYALRTESIFLSDTRASR